MDLFTIVGVAIVSFGVGIMSGISICRRAEEKQADMILDEIEKVIEQQRQNTLYVKVDIVDDVIYVYEKETDKFLFQVKSFDELKEILAEQFPNRNILTSREDMDKLDAHEPI